ncbi:MAG: NADH:ubiquinone reductase (Na(+)-transporting) subunit E [Spirochaetes bacterium]|nr:NADH:ubiquinone reductase (Na(+)-transporting) subunit E [Spirochaetota bacterium]
MNLISLYIFIGSILTNNILLTNFLGMCSFLAVSKDIKTSAGLGLAVTFVMTFTTGLNWLVYYFILVPLKLEFLRFIIFIIVIAAFVQILEMIIERVSENLYISLGIFLPLITVNCAILGVCLFMIIRNYNFINSVIYGFGGGLGWSFAIIVMAGIRSKLKLDKIPKGLENAGIALIIAGIMALIFTGFAGIIKI